jgi:hypothetical protein
MGAVCDFSETATKQFYVDFMIPWHSSVSHVWHNVCPAGADAVCETAYIAVSFLMYFILRLFHVFATIFSKTFLGINCTNCINFTHQILGTLANTICTRHTLGLCVALPPNCINCINCINLYSFMLQNYCINAIIYSKK